MGKLSNQPYRGTKDYFPKDYKVLKYIFDVWRRVCESYGYEEYQTPVIENAQIYREKSGEDVGGEELFTLTDQKGRDLALRPEMTPSVTRMVSQRYKELPKPIRLFSIGSFYRSERPQKGRNREFWQLNVDIFGETSLYADVEVIKLAIDIMLAFNAPKGSFKLFVNSRKLTDALMDILSITPENRAGVVRAMDKYGKILPEKFEAMLKEKGLDEEKIRLVRAFLESDATNLLEKFPTLSESDGYKDVALLREITQKLGYQPYIEFKPGLVRGLDYYDGIVFEVFDTNSENTRSLFGGGRYNGLAELFGGENFPAVGFAPGNETTKIFLETWNLLPDFTKEAPVKAFVTAISSEAEAKIKMFETANALRKQTRGAVETDTSSLSTANDALRYANKKGFDYVVMIGDEELSSDTVTIKNLKTGEQKTASLDEAVSELI